MSDSNEFRPTDGLPKLVSGASPWDRMQAFDAQRYGADVLDPAEQTRWAQAFLLGGLPYMWRMAASVLKQIYALAEIKSGDKVLLFGESLESCGFVEDLHGLVGPSGKVVSIDIQQDARTAVASRKRDSLGRLGTFPHDFTRDYPNEVFDVVLNLQGVQHAEDWSVTGREFLRVMAPGRRYVMGEIVMGSPQQLARIDADLHIRQVFDKILSRRGFGLDELAYYSPEALHAALDGQLEDTGHFEWHGLEVFYGRKPK